jgi:hypothetical protein
MWMEKVVDEIGGLGDDYDDLVNAEMFDHKYGTPTPFKFHADLVAYAGGTNSPTTLNTGDATFLAPLDATLQFNAVDDGGDPASNDADAPGGEGFIDCVESLDHPTCGHGPGVYDTNTGWNYNWDSVNPHWP